MSLTDADRKAEEIWSDVEKSTNSKLHNDKLRAQLEAEINPKRRLLHKLFVFISILAGLSAIVMGIGQFIGIFFQQVGPIQYVLRLYVIVLCVLAVLVELQWTKFARESKIFSYWITRGLFYAFIGVLGLEENDTSSTRHESWKDYTTWTDFLKAIAWIMIGCGALYFFMGLFCLQIIYNRLRNEYEERLKRAPDVKHAAETYGSAEPL